MSRECLIEYRQNGAALDLDVEAKKTADTPGFKTQVQRPQLQLAPADMNQLRGGQPDPAVIDQVSLAVSRWLLSDGNSLDLPLLLALGGNPAAPPWRLVFSSEKVGDETLRQGLAEVPIELLQPPGFAIPLALHASVRSFVHRLPKTGAAPLSGTSRNWPFRVLIVRSNPADLGGAVPKAEPIRQAILQASQGAAARGQIHVDILSSEAAAGLAGRPTADQLFNQVVKPYDMLIYLGHGDTLPNPAGGPALGALLLESDDGAYSRQVDAKQLSGLLNKNPIPVVLLVGCLTAAEIPAPLRSQVEAAIPGWIRGSQGVAQALVNGQSGVHFVIGMRFKIERQDAENFVKVFFEVLLSPPTAGDLEAALHGARHKLHFNGIRPSWAAPVAFRTDGEEPTFPYLATVPPPTNIPLSPKDEKLRAELWRFLADINKQLRGAGLHGKFQGLLESLEQEYFDGLAAQGSLLIPERRDVDPDSLIQGTDNQVEVRVQLRNPLQVRSMYGAVTTSGGKLLSVELAPELDALGLELFTQSFKENRLKFHLRSDHPINVPPGWALKVVLGIPKETPAVYVVGLEVLQMQPAVPLGSVNNAVIVFAP